MDQGASNNMTCHDEWFEHMRAMDVIGYVEIGDDTHHAITHVRSVPLMTCNGEVKCMSNVLHVPSITMILDYVGQMVG